MCVHVLLCTSRRVKILVVLIFKDWGFFFLSVHQAVYSVRISYVNLVWLKTPEWVKYENVIKISLKFGACTWKTISLASKYYIYWCIFFYNWSNEHWNSASGHSQFCFCLLFSYSFMIIPFYLFYNLFIFRLHIVKEC